MGDTAAAFKPEYVCSDGAEAFGLHRHRRLLFNVRYDRAEGNGVGNASADGQTLRFDAC